MDEAERCERLLLMRDGRLLADEPVAALLSRTGCPDVETAFLSLVAGADVPA
jgi:ABC-2 type transport system ATP-binding protein